MKVCAGYYQFETAGVSQTVCDCHIANPDKDCVSIPFDHKCSSMKNVGLGTWLPDCIGLVSCLLRGGVLGCVNWKQSKSGKITEASLVQLNRRLKGVSF